MKISIDKLHASITQILSKNLSDSDASKVADYLVWAEMSGINTQGVVKLTGSEPIQDLVAKHDLIIEHDTKLSSRINAGGQPGVLAAFVATERALVKAREHGIAIIGTHNIFSSNGAQSYYVEKLAKEGLIAIMCSRSPSSTTGFGSIDPLFGTNPLAVAFPTSEDPVVFDMATSAITFYGLVLANARGEKIPPNMAIDANGDPTTDPAKAMVGAILPFDRSYKGAGLGMIVEMLAGPLVGAAFIDNQTFKEEWGSLVIAFDPALLIDSEKFKQHCTEMVGKIKHSRKQPGVNEIRLPGERSRANYRSAKASGLVDVDEVILRQLNIV